MAAFLIESASEVHAPEIAEIYRPFVEESIVSFELQAPGAEEMARRIEAVQPRYPWLVCLHGKEVIGYAYATEHRSRRAYQWTTESSIYMKPAWRGKGVAKLLYQALLDLLALQGYQQALAGIALPNPASVAFHQKLGFSQFALYKRVGFKLGKWHDTCWLACMLRQDEAAPALASIHEALASEQGKQAIQKATEALNTLS